MTDLGIMNRPENSDRPLAVTVELRMGFTRLENGYYEISELFCRVGSGGLDTQLSSQLWIMKV